MQPGTLGKDDPLWDLSSMVGTPEVKSFPILFSIAEELTCWRTSVPGGWNRTGVEAAEETLTAEVGGWKVPADTGTWLTLSDENTWTLEGNPRFSLAAALAVCTLWDGYEAGWAANTFDSSIYKNIQTKKR